MTVNIYIQTTAKGGRNRNVGFAYVIECEILGQIKTVTGVGTLHDVTKNEAERKAFLTALKRIKPGNEITLFTDSAFLGSVLETWLPLWQQHSWKNSKGDDVNPEWQEVANLLVKRPTKINHEKHSYSSWLRSEAERNRPG